MKIGVYESENPQYISVKSFHLMTLLEGNVGQA